METMYAPAPSDQTMRLASVAAARHFGTEAVQIHGCASETEVVAYRVDGWNPKGWANLGPSILLTVNEDGTVTISDD